jgi:hypothetical protein
MTALFLFNTILFAILFMAWKKSDWLNFMFKAAFLAEAVSNGFCFFQAMGFVVRHAS